MKINKFRHRIMLWVGIPWFVGALLFFLFFPQWILRIYHLHWIILIGVIAISITPYGKIKLGTASHKIPTHSFLSWLTKTWAFQTSLIALFMGISYLTKDLHQNLFTETWTTLSLNYALFPWGMIALFAIAMGLISYHKNEDAFLHTLIYPVTKSGAKDVLGISFNFDSKTAIFVAISSSFCFMILFLIFLFSPSLLSTGFHLNILLTTTAALFIFLSTPFKKFLQQILEKKIKIILSVLIILLVCAAIIIFLNYLFIGLEKISFKTPSAIQFIQRINSQQIWLIFSLCWFSSWTLIAAAYLAFIANGLTIRQIIWGILIGPLVFTLLLKIIPDISYTHFQIFGFFFIFLGMFGFIGLFWSLLQKKVLTMMNLSYLPAAHIEKQRNYRLLLRRFFQFAIVLFYLFLPTHLLLITPLFFSMTFLILMAAPLVLVSFFDHARLK